VKTVSSVFLGNVATKQLTTTDWTEGCGMKWRYIDDRILFKQRPDQTAVIRSMVPNSTREPC